MNKNGKNFIAARDVENGSQTGRTGFGHFGDLQIKQLIMDFLAKNLKKK